MKDAHGDFPTHDACNDPMARLVEVIKDECSCSTECIKKMSQFKDHQCKSFMDVAPQQIKRAVEDRILFLSRCETHDGPPIHKSDASIVLKACDMRMHQHCGTESRKVKKSHDKNGWAHR